MTHEYVFRSLAWFLIALALLVVTVRVLVKIRRVRDERRLLQQLTDSILRARDERR